MKGFVEELRGFSGKAGNGKKLLQARLPQALKGAKTQKKKLLSFFADSGELIEEARKGAALPQSAVVFERKAVGLVPQALEEM